MSTTTAYETVGRIGVQRTIERIPVQNAIEPVIHTLDQRRGVLLASSYEYPGRYTRWDMGFVDPPLVLSARGREFRIQALNGRGQILLPPIAEALRSLEAVERLAAGDNSMDGVVRKPSGRFVEEERSRQPSLFSVLRELVALFRHPDEAHLGLYGAFGYDLAFQFEPIRLRLERPPGQRDLLLYLPDEIIIVDHRREVAQRRRYEFTVAGHSTEGLPRTGRAEPYVGTSQAQAVADHRPGEYASMVRIAREAFKRGDLFEVVPGQTFFEACLTPPSQIFLRLRERNPSPYGFLMNLGEAEYLVGASPEMYVRVDDDRVETCPISGTIARGRDPIGDAAQIVALLTSAKDESELTMCTDVDRNDKSRVCVPGSVRVIGRRQIEMYSRLIHTVDHVEGRLQPGRDALDAFLAHTWADTVTGAPKAWAMQFIEDHERSSRAWYGGAVGVIGFDGNLNTGLTLRTIRVKNGVAEVRAGATLLYDSDPESEEAETELKASAFLDAIRLADGAERRASAAAPRRSAGRRVLLVDHQDSFVHTLANYLRQTGAEVVTLRAGFPTDTFDDLKPHLAVLSPGPARRAAPASYPDLRCMPRPTGHGRVLRGPARRPRSADARQGLAHPRARRANVRGTAVRIQRRPLPFALRRARGASSRARSDCRERRRRGDGRRASDASVRSRAVSPGVDHDARRRLRAAVAGERRRVPREPGASVAADARSDLGDREGEAHRRAAADLALDVEFATVSEHQMLDDRQAEAGAAQLA
jgi:anthranilate synthase